MVQQSKGLSAVAQDWFHSQNRDRVTYNCLYLRGLGFAYMCSSREFNTFWCDWVPGTMCHTDGNLGAHAYTGIKLKRTIVKTKRTQKQPGI